MTKKNGYVVQPKGTALYEDSSSFGSRMLAKMGWTKGKGLGASENGSVDFVRVKYKNDAGGFGYTARDDQWTENESGFHTLLQSLNETDEAEAERKRQSLEEKSKLSRARVHYQKFTRGKDISRYSEKDLANIFGKKSLTDAYKVETKEQEEDEKSDEDKGKVLQDHGTMIINTGVSITDYFKNKRKKATETNNEDATPENGSDSKEEVREEEEPVKEKKKKRKRKEIDETTEASVPEETQNNEQEEASGPVKKKKKKGDKQEPNVEETVQVEIVIEKENPPKQKKKKNKKTSESPETLVESTSSSDPTLENPPVKKSKKKKIVAPNEEEDLNKYFLDALAVEKLKQIRLDKFTDSNVSDIVGYGLSNDLKLEIRDSSIIKGISNTNKYSIYSNVDKLHNKSYYKSLLLRYHKKRNTFKLE